ncbi:Crp/Fnr family transcriptional regulator, partial [Enterococcus faecium]
TIPYPITLKELAVNSGTTRETDKYGSIIYGTDESELILQPHFHFRY